MVVAAVFRGDASQMRALIVAIERNCVCHDHPPTSCEAHKALLSQRFLDGLLWMQYLRERLLDEEHGAPAGSAAR